MAKPKLSEVQRKALRSDIKARLSKKEAPAVIIKAISEKYKIVSFTARWYLKTVLASRPGRKPGKKKAAITGRASSVKSSTPARKIRKRNKKRIARGASTNGILEAAISKSIQRASLAKKLYPKLQATLNRARDLRRQEAKNGKSARATEIRAKKLETQIRALTS